MKILCTIGIHDWVVRSDGEACEDCGYCALATRTCKRCGKKQMIWHPPSIREDCYWTDEVEGVA